MRPNVFINSLSLLLLLSIANAEEWYQKGHQDLLNWDNFDSTVNTSQKFKFVKFFTRNCRYCRLLKEVEEQLRVQKTWNFEFYDVDCSINYDLCLAKATITSFPYVAIYNTNGEVAGKIGGYYPLDTMREGFKTIENWQNQQLGKISTTNSAQVQPQAQQQARPKPSTITAHSFTPTTPTPPATSEKDHKTQISNESKKEKKVNPKNGEEDGEWSNSIKEGIKMLIILASVIFFNKIILPFLKQDEQSQNYSKPHLIQLPLHPTSTSSTAKDHMNDTL